MPILYLANERSGARWQVWPEAETMLAGEVQEAQGYLFHLEDLPGSADADLFIDDTRLEALRPVRPDCAMWRWSPGFHAGLVDGELRFGGGAVRFSFVTDPARSKLIRDDFDVMVREILDDTFALFSISGFRKGIARGQGQRVPPIARLEFVRSRIAKIESTVLEIVRTPRRSLETNQESLRFHRLTRVTGPEILRSMRTGRLIHEQRSPAKLPPVLRGVLPQTIRVRRPRFSTDIAEHRQILSCIRAWSAWLRTIEAILASQAASGTSAMEDVSNAATWARRCRKLSHCLDSLSTNEFFVDVGGAPPSLRISQIFRRDPKYRQFYRLWQDMNAGLASVFGDFLSMPLSRTFELYELWCYLRLLRAAAEEFGAPLSGIDGIFQTDGRGGITIAASALAVSVGERWTLLFQRQFQEYWLTRDKKGTFSRWMTPDVVLSRVGKSGAPGMIVLDAKYRIESELNDALSSIHTYRDALVSEYETGTLVGVVSAAYLLTPHIPNLSPSFEETAMPSRLFHPAYRGKFRFGAATLRPGMAVSEVRATLRDVLSDAGM